MIIDTHTHVFPASRSKETLADLRQRTGIPHYTSGDLDGLKASMRSAGIDMAIVSRITTDPKRVKSVNNWLLECRQERIRPLAAIHPDVPDVQTYVAGLKDAGFLGIKIHPDYQGFYVDDPAMLPVYEAAESAGLPILFHAGLDRGLPPPVRAMPNRLLNIHELFPNLAMVAAHMGGEDNYDETVEYLLGKDIYLDTAFVLSIMTHDTLRTFFSKHPIERFLFGTDSPFANQTIELNCLKNFPFLNSEEKQKIMSLNAAELYHL